MILGEVVDNKKDSAVDDADKHAADAIQEVIYESTGGFGILFQQRQGEQLEKYTENDVLSLFIVISDHFVVQKGYLASV